LTGEGLEDLSRAIGDTLRAHDRTVELAVPYDRGDVVAALHRAGEVLESHDTGSGLAVRARLDEAGRRRFASFLAPLSRVGDADGSDGGAL
jgi:GTP-binding protein HflX